MSECLEETRDKWQPKITLKQFEKRYIKRSRMTREDYNEYRVTLPCNCGEDGCEGWASVGKPPDIIHDHTIFFFPPINEYLEYTLKSRKRTKVSLKFH